MIVEVRGLTGERGEAEGTRTGPRGQRRLPFFPLVRKGQKALVTKGGNEVSQQDAVPFSQGPARLGLPSFLLSLSCPGYRWGHVPLGISCLGQLLGRYWVAMAVAVLRKTLVGRARCVSRAGFVCSFARGSPCPGARVLGGEAAGLECQCCHITSRGCPVSRPGRCRRWPRSSVRGRGCQFSPL